MYSPFNVFVFAIVIIYILATAKQMNFKYLKPCAYDGFVIDDVRGQTNVLCSEAFNVYVLIFFHLGPAVPTKKNLTWDQLLLEIFP